MARVSPGSAAKTPTKKPAAKKPAVKKPPAKKQPAKKQPAAARQQSVPSSPLSPPPPPTPAPVSVASPAPGSPVVPNAPPPRKPRKHAAMRAEKEDKERKKKERKEKEKEKGIEESVAAPKKDRSLLPAGYAASAVPVRTGSADPCLRCVKQLDKTPGSGCPKIPHAACLRCSKAKVKCEEVSDLLSFLPLEGTPNQNKPIGEANSYASSAWI
jgi:hypothetical protein